MAEQLKPTGPPISYGAAQSLHNVLVGLNTKSISNTNYVKLLHLKREMKKHSEAFDEMLEEIVNDCKLERNIHGQILIKPSDTETSKKFELSVKSLSKLKVDVKNEKFLTMEEFEALRQSNTLTLEQELIIIDWIVIE